MNLILVAAGSVCTMSGIKSAAVSALLGGRSATTMWRILMVFIFGCACVVQCMNNNKDNSSIEVDSSEYSVSSSAHTTENLTDNEKNIIKQVIARKCTHRYTTTCLKLDIVKFVNRLSTAESYQLLPGVTVIRTGASNLSRSDVPTEIVASIVRNNSSPEELDSFLKQKMDNYLSSLSIRVSLLDNPVFERLKKIGNQIVSAVYNPSSLVTGRSKKKDHNAAIWSAATLAALGFAGLAAMSGKAMMTATLALILSIMCLLKGCGNWNNFGSTSRYEIITKPAHLHEDHVHSSSLAGSPYGYARHFVEEKLVPDSAVNAVDSMEDHYHPPEAIPLSNVNTYHLPTTTYIKPVGI